MADKLVAHSQFRLVEAPTAADNLFRDALTFYQHALRDFPDEPEAWIRAGAFLWREKQYEQAADHIDRALRLDAASPQAHFFRGLIWRDTGKLDQAITCMRKSLELNPEANLDHQLLADVLISAGRRNEAEDCYTRLIEREPELVVAYRLRGDLRLDMGRAKEALADYHAALAIDESYVKAMYGAVKAALALGKLDQAEAEARRAVKASRAKPYGHAAMGLVLARRGEDAKALREYTTAIKFDRDFAPAWMEKIRLQLKMGRTEPAWRTLQDGLSWKAPFDDAFVRRVAAETGHTLDE